MEENKKLDLSNPMIAEPLTEEERKVLWAYKDSHQFKIFAKAITFMYARQAAYLVEVKPEYLQQAQGRLQGLLQARTLVNEAIVPPDQIAEMGRPGPRLPRLARPIIRKNISEPL